MIFLFFFFWWSFMCTVEPLFQDHPKNQAKVVLRGDALFYDHPKNPAKVVLREDALFLRPS